MKRKLAIATAVCGGGLLGALAFMLNILTCLRDLKPWAPVPSSPWPCTAVHSLPRHSQATECLDHQTCLLPGKPIWQSGSTSVPGKPTNPVAKEATGAPFAPHSSKPPPDRRCARSRQSFWNWRALTKIRAASLPQADDGVARSKATAATEGPSVAQNVDVQDFGHRRAAYHRRTC